MFLGENNSNRKIENYTNEVNNGILYDSWSIALILLNSTYIANPHRELWTSDSCESASCCQITSPEKGIRCHGFWFCNQWTLCWQKQKQGKWRNMHYFRWNRYQFHGFHRIHLTSSHVLVKQIEKTSVASIRDREITWKRKSKNPIRRLLSVIHQDLPLINRLNSQTHKSLRQ